MRWWRSAVGAIAMALATAIANSVIASPVPAHTNTSSDLQLIRYPSAFVARQTGTIYKDRIAGWRGYLAVPVNRQDHESGVIMTGFWQFESTAKSPRGPIFFLYGGPGHANVDVWQTRNGIRRLRRLLTVADVILFDQRGAGSPSLSIPSLHCPNTFAFGLDEPWQNRDEVINGFRRHIRECAAYYNRHGIDLRGYNTVQSAADIEDLRRALGYEQVNIWGQSYGSYLARTFIELYPDSVERAVIGKIIGKPYFPLENPMDVAFAKLATGFTTDSGRKIAPDPDFHDAFVRLLERLSSAPAIVPIIRPDTGVAARLALGAYDLQFVAAYYTRDSTDDWVKLREAVYDMLKGNFEWLAERAIEWRLGKHRSFYEGKLLGLLATCNAIDGAAYAAAVTVDADSPFGLEFGTGPMPYACDALEDYRSPDNVQWTPSKVPALFWNGDTDPTTPLARAREVAQLSENAILIILSGASHRASARTLNRLDRRILRFLAGEPVANGRVETLR